MDFRGIMNAVIRQSGYTQTSLAEALGLTQSAINSRLGSNMRVESMAEMLDAMGYRLVIVPKAKKVQGAIEVE